MPYQHILVAVDLTEECDPVIKRAQESALANGAILSLVHIRRAHGHGLWR